MSAPSPARARPRLHFTPRAGWINDPHGVVHADGVYHLFFQYNPAGTRWGTAVSWGHATSADLITWAEEPVALTPQPGEIGCWSGSVVRSDRGVPTLFYTRIVQGDSSHGQIARALGDPRLGRWRRDPVEPVIRDAPAGVLEFRDPYVWRASDDWRMVVGARLDGEIGALVQYRSADLREWSYDGILVQRPATETAGAWTGSMWECPQLFPLDGTWVLLLSVLHGESLNGVAYALGDYDGHRFVPHVWGEFSRGRQMYATTAFVDAEGRRCVMSWLRETAAGTPPGSPWAGALSLPWVLRVEDDLLIADPHPHLAGYRADEPPAVVAARGFTSVLDGGGELLRLPGEGRVTVIADADIVEVTVEGVSGIGAARLTSCRGG